MPCLDIPALPPGCEPRHLLEAAPAALALPDLCGRSEPGVAAKAAFVQLACASAETSELAGSLGCTPRAVQLLRHRPVPAPLLRAVALGAGLREVHAQGVPRPLLP